MPTQTIHPCGHMNFWGTIPDLNPGEECWVIAFKNTLPDGRVSYTVCCDRKTEDTVVLDNESGAKRAAKKRTKTCGRDVVSLRLVRRETGPVEAQERGGTG